jgi:hypothetical protein
MIHTHCEIKKEHSWGVGQTGPRPTIAQIMAAGATRERAREVRKLCHDAVILLVGSGWEQVQITLTPEEARWLAEDLLEKAKEVEARTGKAKR